MKINKTISITILSSFILSCNSVNLKTNQNTQNEVISQSNISTYSKVKTDDSDLSGSNQSSINSLNKKLGIETVSEQTVFKAKKLKNGINLNNSSGLVKGVINYYDDKGKLKKGSNITVKLTSNNRVVAETLTDMNGSWQIKLNSENKGKKLKTVFEMANKYWNIQSRRRNYQWEGDEFTFNNSFDTGIYAPVKGSENAKIAYIHDIYNRYINFFNKENVEIDSWWKKPINTVYPGRGDYYNWGTVNLTDAKQWDVNGHEVGHAITDIGTNSKMGGGQHKIDECYSTELAWSEGFASFLGAVVSIDKNDPDAKFEFLVKRRAPIRFENVPEDVCNGQNNEWRVTAAVWDIYDLHKDGSDETLIPFKTIWNSLNRSERSIGSLNDAIKSLKEKTSTKLHAKIDRTLSFNTIQ